MRLSGRRVAAGLGLALGLAGTSGLTSGAWAAAPPAAGAAVRRAATAVPAKPSILQLVNQTAWVTARHPFVLDLSVAGGAAVRDDLLSVVIYNPLHSRNAFDQTLNNQIPTYPLQGFGPFPLHSLPRDPDRPGAVQVPITVATPGQSRPASATNVVSFSCATGCAGVYPVRVVLQQAGTGTPVGSLTTTLVYTGGLTPGSRRLDLAWALPLAAPTRMSPGGGATIGRDDAAKLAGLVAAVSANPTVALTVQPSPVTLAALLAWRTTADRTTLAELRQWAMEGGHQVAGAPYAPLALADLTNAGLGDQLPPALARGGQVARTVLGVRPSTTTWVVSHRLDRRSLELLQSLPGRTARQLVVPADDLAPLAERITAVQPFLLTATDSPVLAMTADSGLGRDLARGSEPMLAAHQFLADLAMIYFDQPNAPYTRGVIVNGPAVPNASNTAVVADALSALASSPLVQPVTLDQYFRQVSPAKVYGTDLVRQLAARSGSGLPSLPGRAIRARLGEVTAFQSVLTTGRIRALITEPMTDLLLASQAVDISPAQRAGYLSSIDRLVHRQLSRIQLPTERVTLTATSGELPVTVVSHAPYPLRGIVEIRSDGFTFPGRSSRPVTLRPHRSITLHFEVRAGARGRVPVQIRLVSPRGRLVLASNRLGVSSSAFSDVAIGLTVAAGAFLMLWWASTLRKGRRRRNRRLVPAGE